MYHHSFICSSSIQDMNRELIVFDHFMPFDLISLRKFFFYHLFHNIFKLFKIIHPIISSIPYLLDVLSTKQAITARFICAEFEVSRYSHPIKAYNLEKPNERLHLKIRFSSMLSTAIIPLFALLHSDGRNRVLVKGRFVRYGNLF